ncbi:MAG: hypothetical protein ACOVR6_08420 [Fimbriimonas sp.]
MKHVIRIRTIFLLLMASVLGSAHGSISSVVCKMACCQPSPVVEKIIVATAPLSCCHPVTLSPSIHLTSVISKKDDCCCKTASHLIAPDLTSAVAVSFITLNSVADVVQTIDVKIPLPPVVVVARLSSDVDPPLPGHEMPARLRAPPTA